MSSSILTIDDSPDVHKLLAVRLGDDSFVLHHAFDARDGLRQARSLRPDLILLDVDMPDVTGFEACQWLKADPATATTPVIFLSAATQAFEKVQGFDLGAVDYITKPFEGAELRARVNAALRAKRKYDLLTAQSQVDALTGLWNRGYFNQRLHDEIAAARRFGRALSLVLIDIDHFKQVNDEHGHPFGDQVLSSVGKMLRETGRDTDIACRYGGEELAVVLTDTDVSRAALVAERLRTRIAAIPFQTRGRVLAVTASFGVTGDGPITASCTSESVIAAADKALYEAKRDGRNCIRVAPLTPTR